MLRPALAEFSSAARGEYFLAFITGLSGIRAACGENSLQSRILRILKRDPSIALDLRVPRKSNSAQDDTA
jgi:hypothetical protein